MAYVYLILDPATGIPAYYGETLHKNRIYKHLARVSAAVSAGISRHHRYALYEHLAGCINRGFRVDVKLIPCESKAAAVALQDKLIAEHAAAYDTPIFNKALNKEHLPDACSAGLIIECTGDNIALRRP